MLTSSSFLPALDSVLSKIPNTCNLFSANLKFILSGAVGNGKLTTCKKVTLIMHLYYRFVVITESTLIAIVSQNHYTIISRHD